MTDYSHMPAGQEMDRLIAEKVMGWNAEDDRAGLNARYWREDPVHGKYWVITSGDDDYSWQPSALIEHAMEAAEKLMHLGFTMNLWFDERAVWWCCYFDRGSPGMMCTGENMAQAICRAVLAAVE